MVTTRSGANSVPPAELSETTGSLATATNTVTAAAVNTDALTHTASSKLRIRALVTGGAGFLGRHVVQQLLDSGRYEVRVFDVRSLEIPGLHASLVGDLRKPEDVAAAVAGMDVVFHIATAAPTGENALNIALMNGVNVDGTKYLLDACLAAGVPKVVYTSSASVVFDGRPLNDVGESAPYAARPMDHYTRTKIEGEKLVLSYNGRPLAKPGAGGETTLATVALRPSGIFGEGDAVFVPTLVRNARAGKMKYVLGSGRNKMDFTYAGNVAHAHLLAVDALTTSSSAVAGKPYFITNDQPKPFWGMMGDVCEGLGYARPRIHLPTMLVLFLAMVFEYLVLPLARLFGKQLKSDFTVNRILLATTHRTFKIERARADLGYKPQLSLAEAITKTLASFEHLRAAPAKGAKVNGTNGTVQNGGASDKKAE